METEMQNPVAESQMKLVVEGRRQMVYEGLIADSVVTAGTLWDTYEICLEEAQAFHLYTTTRRVDTPTEPGDGPDVTFVMFEPRFLECSTRQLCVYAGVAELRHQLGVQPHAWSIGARTSCTKASRKATGTSGTESASRSITTPGTKTSGNSRPERWTTAKSST